MFHGIAAAVQLIGLAVAAIGAARVFRAPALAARRAGLSTPAAPADAQRYTRGLTDFYRISGAIAVLAGVLLLLVPIFAA